MPSTRWLKQHMTVLQESLRIVVGSGDQQIIIHCRAVFFKGIQLTESDLHIPAVQHDADQSRSLSAEHTRHDIRSITETVCNFKNPCTQRTGNPDRPLFSIPFIQHRGNNRNRYIRLTCNINKPDHDRPVLINGFIIINYNDFP